MLTGWDNEGPQLYYLDNDGTRIKGNIFSCGSGSTYAYGVLDTYYKHELSLDEAVELGKQKRNTKKKMCFSSFVYAFLSCFCYKFSNSLMLIIIIVLKEKEQFIMLLTETLHQVVS